LPCRAGNVRFMLTAVASSSVGPHLGAPGSPPVRRSEGISPSPGALAPGRAVWGHGDTRAGRGRRRPVETAEAAQLQSARRHSMASPPVQNTRRGPSPAKRRGEWARCRLELHAARCVRV
jgi:hypothetical protein